MIPNMRRKKEKKRRFPLWRHRRPLSRSSQQLWERTFRGPSLFSTSPHLTFSPPTLFSDTFFLGNRIGTFFSTSNRNLPSPFVFNPVNATHLTACEYPPPSLTSGTGPEIYAYPTLPKDFPAPAIGGHELIGTNGSICYTSTSRYLPYGISNIDTEWEDISWGSLQQKCLERNKHLYERAPARKRQAVVLRGHNGFAWRPNDFHYTRSLIAELSLASGGEYEVIILLQLNGDEYLNLTLADMKNADITTPLREKFVPAEFRDIAVFFTENMLKELYPNIERHDYQMQPYQAVQWLALNRPEFEFWWTIEQDFRYTGHNYEFFDRVGRWARDQPREFMWERNAGFYIGKVHRDWEGYSRDMKRNAPGKGVLGPLGPPEEGMKGEFKHWKGWKPAMPLPENVPSDWGVGEDADVISLSPIWDPVGSAWIFEGAIRGYPDGTPRRASPPSQGRFSKRVLMLTHDEQVEHGSWVEGEMTNPTTALHHGLKALYVPHPIYFDEDIDHDVLYHVFNGAEPGETIEKLNHPKSYLPHAPWQDRWKRVTYSWANELSGELYKWWIGKDGGGRDPAMLRVVGEGEPCFPAMALHPVKDV
jgi:Protein of unknown function (DUF3405)